MNIHPLALLALCMFCTGMSYIIGKVTAAKQALKMALDISSVFDLHLEPIEPIKPLYYRGAIK